MSDAIRRFLEDELPGVELGDDDDLLRPGLLDSLGIVRLVAALEDEEGVTIGQDEIQPERFRSIASIRALVSEKKASERERGPSA